VSYGGITLGQTRLRWVWFLLLIGALGIGVAEDPILNESGTGEADPALLEGDPPTRTVYVTVPLPFYRYDRQRTYVEGRLAAESITRGVLIPWTLLSALLAYLVLVVRWNRENRWAKRILHGRRWPKKEPPVEK